MLVRRIAADRHRSVRPKYRCKRLSTAMKTTHKTIRSSSQNVNESGSACLRADQSHKPQQEYNQGIDIKHAIFLSCFDHIVKLRFIGPAVCPLAGIANTSIVMRTKREGREGATSARAVHRPV